MLEDVIRGTTNHVLLVAGGEMKDSNIMQDP